MVGDDSGQRSKSRRGAAPASTSEHPSPAARASAGAVSGDLKTAAGIEANLERIFWKLETAEHRLVGELTDRQIKICRILLDRRAQEDLLARIEKLEASNRELESKLAGGVSGDAIVRANAAPPFQLPAGGKPH